MSSDEEGGGDVDLLAALGLGQFTKHFRRPAAADGGDDDSHARQNRRVQAALAHEEDGLNDDANWDKGLTGFSEDEASEEKHKRVVERRKRAVQESCIAEEAETIRQQHAAENGGGKRRKHKKKKKKKHKKKTRVDPSSEEEVVSEDDDDRKERRRKVPSVDLRLHAGVTIATNNGITVSIPMASRLLKSSPKAHASRFGDLLYDNALAADAGSLPKSGLPETNRAARYREERDIACIREAHLSGKDMGEFSIRLGLARGAGGSKERSDNIVSREPRHHTLKSLPPFAAFTPHCADSFITKPVGCKDRVFPQQLLALRTVDTLALSKDVGLSCPCLGGFEMVSGVRRAKGGDGATVRVSRDAAEDATLKPLFRIRSSYGDFTRSYWLELSPRDIAVGHLIIQDLFEMSGIKADSGAGVLPPVTDYFESNVFNPPDGRVPWMCGEQSSMEFRESPIAAEGVPIGKNDTWTRHTDLLRTTYIIAVEGVIKVSLPEKRVVFQDARNPLRPPRCSTFPDEAMKRFFEACPEIAEPLELWETAEMIHPIDRSRIRSRYLAFIAGYLDWRYFVLQDYVIGILAVAYETVYPNLNEAMPIRVLEQEATRTSVYRTRMCEDWDISQTPAIHILFYYYRDTCYEKYAAALLTWNFIGGKKVELNKRIVPHMADRERLKKMIRDGKLRTTALPRLPSTKYRPDIVPFDAVFDMHGRGEDGNADMGSLDLTEFFNHVLEKLNDVYKWNFFPQLCHKDFFTRPHRTEVIDPVSLLKDDAIGQRRVEEEKMLKELSASPKEMPAEWKGKEELVARSAMRRGKILVSIDNMPEACQEPVTRALDMFNESFSIIGQNDSRRSMPHSQKIHWTTRRALRLIRAAMRKHNQFHIPKVCTNAVMVAYVTANRRDSPKIACYTSNPKRSLLFVLNSDTDLYRWYINSGAATNTKELEKWGR